MCKEQNVLNYYVVCNKLKNVIRTGWKDWKVKRERIESVAEHITYLWRSNACNCNEIRISV